MNKDRTILIRYDEIGLKGKNRWMFIDCLVSNIQQKLRELKNIRIRAPHGRVMIACLESQVEDCINGLQFVPGISSMSVGIETEPDFDKLAKIGIDWIDPILKNKSELKFCVRTQRSNKLFPHTSQEIDREVGGRIMANLQPNGLRVNINEAEYVLEIEIGQEQTVIFSNRIKGLCGLPVGSSGPVLGMISGGIDSPVAMFRMIRRGCIAHGIFFDNQPFMGRGGYDKVLRLAKVLNRFQGKGKLFVVPFENIQISIRDQCTPSNRVVLYRRMMYRIAEAVAQSFGYKGLVTGESLGQVASQTLENLSVVSEVVTMSVFRPLIGMGKQEIISEAKALETYEISIEPHPDCCSVFMPPKPVTRGKSKYMNEDELKYPWQQLMSEAIEKMEILELKTAEI